MPWWEKSSLFVKIQSFVFVLFRLQGRKLVISFPSRKKGPDHKPPGSCLRAQLKRRLNCCSSVSQCECVSLFVLRVCFLSPTPFSLSLSLTESHLVLSLSLSSLSLFFPLTASGALTQHTSCTQTVLLLLCAGIADSFCTLNGRESSCRNHSHCFPSNSSYSFVC